MSLTDLLTDICPKLPIRDKIATREYYKNLGFREFGSADFNDYLMVQSGNIQVHFFLFKELDPRENYGQVYIRTNDADALYALFQAQKADIHPNGHLAVKPWGQKEFSMLDPDNNLLTFGQSLG